ncbi:Hypothetical protein DHA2_151122 [Giardia duodenalis]|uniref:RING-type domain-containing protein n=1 Tax=Giardia intestinalis TaxID=5741 RepID=V6TKK4_GIAIN|nr:Hypothetical protein DHA2_151122 [Giardia intestinalis]
MNAYALSTGGINESDGQSTDSDLLKTTALKAILPIQEIPRALLCPGCGMVYEVAYCLSCSHNVCQWCYEREITQNRYMRCFVCHTLVVSRPYLNSALNKVARGYRQAQVSDAKSYDICQQHPVPPSSEKIGEVSHQWDKYLGEALCGPFFCGEFVLVCDKRVLSMGPSSEIERKTLCLTRFTSSIEVVLVPRHRTQTAFMGLMFVHKGCSPNYTAQLSPLSVKFSITVINQCPEKSRTYECIHTFSRGGGCYNIPIGPRSVLFDPQRNYATTAGAVTIQVSASVFTTLPYEDAVAISCAAQRLLVSTKRCGALNLDALIDCGITHGKPEVAAHITRFLLALATIQYSVVSVSTDTSPQGYQQDITTVALCFWLKESLSFTRLLKRAIRHIDADDYELIGATLGRHCLVFLENGGPADAFDVTLKDGMLSREELDTVCYQGKHSAESSAKALAFEKEARALEAKLRDVEKKLEVQEEQTRLAEHRNSRLESILKKEIVRSSRLKRALLELVGSSNEILDHMLCEQETRRNNSERGPTSPTCILPAGLYINGMLNMAPKEISLLHKGYIELNARDAALSPVLNRLLRKTVLLDIRAVGTSSIAYHLFLMLLSAKPVLRIRYAESESITEFVEPSGNLPSPGRESQNTVKMQTALQPQLTAKRKYELPVSRNSEALEIPSKPSRKDSEHQQIHHQPHVRSLAPTKPSSARSKRH